MYSYIDSYIDPYIDSYIDPYIDSYIDPYINSYMNPCIFLIFSLYILIFLLRHSSFDRTSLTNNNNNYYYIPHSYPLKGAVM